MTSDSSQLGLIADYIDALPERLANAVIGCALPHWFDRAIAIELTATLLRDSSAAQSLVAELLRLPFVYRHSENAWQYTEAARSFCHTRLRARDDEYVELSALMVRLLRSANEQLDQHSAEGDSGDVQERHEWHKRQLQWQLAYHLAPIDNDAAMRQLLGISEAAGVREDRVADQSLALTVWHEQKTFLEVFRVEGAYLEGRYAYTAQDLAVAEDKFAYVWREGARDGVITATAGHLLAVIRRRKGRQKSVEDAEQLLRASLELCERRGLAHRGVPALMARILNSLAATLIQRGDAEALEEAARVVERALELHQTLSDDAGRMQVLNTRATLLMKYGDVGRLTQAETLLRSLLQQSPARLDVRTRSALQSNLAQALIQRSDERALREARKLLVRSLEAMRRFNDKYQEAVLLNRLGECAALWDHPGKREEALDFFQNSLRLYEQLDHVQGQYRVLNNLADTYALLGRRQEERATRARTYGFEL